MVVLNSYIHLATVILLKLLFPESWTFLLYIEPYVFRTQFAFLSPEGDGLDMLVKILYLKELLNMAAAKKVSNNRQKTQDRQISSKRFCF